ncbi:MAG: cytidylate kinase family protein [Candidatus Aenigmatarchaeota archaeon]
MIVTIHGQEGSGKSTTAKMLARRLGFRHYSIGEIRREIARRHGLTLPQLNKIGEKEDWTDKEADRFLEKLGKKGGNLVIDCRLGFHFIPNSFKVYLCARLKVRVERIFRERRKSERFGSIREAEKSIVRRARSDRLRYKKYYNIDITDMRHYDLVIDTTHLSKREVVERILEALRKRQMNPENPKF